MTTPNAIAAIRHTCARFGDRALIGVGTVLDAATCRAALEAGAQFVVTPVLRPELVPITHAVGRPIMLGAYSPTEAQIAHEAGADFIKIFPADGLGPGYMKALRAPLPHLRLVPTGGVDVNNVADFLQAGCAALGVGSLLVSAGILDLRLAGTHSPCHGLRSSSPSGETSPLNCPVAAPPCRGRKTCPAGTALFTISFFPTNCTVRMHLLLQIATKPAHCKTVKAT
jgi:Entner-Doudoroff aldolase